MLKSLITIAFRTLRNDKGYSLLNILGLTIGITFSLLLLFYINDELNFDRYHTHADRIYRVGIDAKEAGKASKEAVTPYMLGPTLQKDYPEVEQSVRFVPNGGKRFFKAGNAEFFEEQVYYADPNVFAVFTSDPIEGDLKTALEAPTSIVLTKTLAEKYFGSSQGVVGKSLQSKGREVYTVSAVIADVPSRSHLRFTALLSTRALPPDYGAGWAGFNEYTYLLLAPHTDPAAFEAKLVPLYEKYTAPLLAKFNVRIRYILQPITAIHLHSDWGHEPSELGSMTYIYTFSAVALFMLLIACINYMNLTTARSARRAKEIGIRKVAGSLRSHLIGQFLSESLVLTLISLGLSLVLVAGLLPIFDEIAGKDFTVSVVLQPVILLSLLGIVVVVGLLGGSYPAFYLSRFNPVVVLKGDLAKAATNALLRQTLVVVQFTISMVMLISTWVVYDQLNFLRTKDIGYNKDQVLVLNLPEDQPAGSKLRALKAELAKNQRIISFSSSWQTPSSGRLDYWLFEIQGKTGFTPLGANTYGIDPNYLNTLGMTMVAGRNFTEADRADSLRRMIVNEAMVKRMGWTNPIGRQIKASGNNLPDAAEVIGVVRDFHEKSLYNPIEPLVLLYREDNHSVQAKISPDQIPSTLAYVERVFSQLFPGEPFDYRFLDQDFQTQFVADQKRGQIFTAFSGLTVLIACLGLLGLVAFTMEQRRKEIGIRKVMGAETGSIVALMTRGFMRLVVVSCLLAFPIAWWAMSQWLAPFPYKTALQPTTFLLSAGVVLLITLLTVSFHAVKAALMNPVKSLRSE